MEAGRRLGRYVLEQRVGEGGMGVVYRARLQGAHGFERTVAVKTIHPALVAEPAVRARFLEEAHILAALHHDNVVPVLDVCDEEGALFLALEWIDGVSLRDLYARAEAHGQRLPIGVTVRIILDVLDGLHHAHELTGSEGQPLGLVHRDVSPENILVTRRGRAKLIDFGLAKACGAAREETQRGTVLGKVSFMPPEQARGGEDLDRRADVWAIGAVLRLLATGTLTYEADSPVQRLYMLTLGQEPDPLPADAPAWLAEICRGTHALAPDERFATCAELAAALRAACPRIATDADVAACVGTLLDDERVSESAIVTQVLAPTKAKGPDLVAADLESVTLTYKQRPTRRPRALHAAIAALLLLPVFFLVRGSGDSAPSALAGAADDGGPRVIDLELPEEPEGSLSPPNTYVPSGPARSASPVASERPRRRPSSDPRHAKPSPSFHDFGF